MQQSLKPSPGAQCPKVNWAARYCPSIRLRLRLWFDNASPPHIQYIQKCPTLLHFCLTRHRSLRPPSSVLPVQFTLVSVSDDKGDAPPPRGLHVSLAQEAHGGEPTSTLAPTHSHAAIASTSTYSSLHISRPAFSDAAGMSWPPLFTLPHRAREREKPTSTEIRRCFCPDAPSRPPLDLHPGA